MGDFDAAAARFSRVADAPTATQDQLYSALLGQAAAAQYRPSPDLGQALDCYQRLGDVKNDAAVPQSMLGIGMVYVAQGKVQEGRAELTSLAKKFPDSDEAGEATVQLVNSLWRPTPDDEAPGGYTLADEALIRRGMDLLEQRLKAYPKSPLAAVMHMMLASKLVEQEAYREAVAQLEAALNGRRVLDHPGQHHVADSPDSREQAARLRPGREVLRRLRGQVQPDAALLPGAARQGPDEGHAGREGGGVTPCAWCGKR